jgi:hypothetical protein
MVDGERKATRNYLFWLAIALCAIYYCYRYPLQINDSGTSPTYSDTPTLLQAGKFVLAVPLIALSLLRWLSSSLKIFNWPVVFCALFLCSFPFLKVLGEFDSQYVVLMFWMIFALTLVLGVGCITISAIDRCFCLLLWYSFATTFLQVLLFATIGRLPALAYAGTYSIRFGGFLDDPNGFPAILFLLMGWSYKRFKGRTRLVALGGLTICLFLTQSWTALGFFLLVLFVFVLVRAFRRPITAIAAIAMLPMVGIVAVRLAPLFQTGFLLEVMESKRGSIEGHVFPWEFWASRWKDWVLLGDSKYNAYESWWQAAVVNFGLVWFFAYFVLVIALLLGMWRAYAKSTPESKPVFSGLLLFGLFFFVGSVNLPFPVVFPINALFFLFFFLVAFGKISLNQRSALAIGATQHLAKATGE